MLDGGDGGISRLSAGSRQAVKLWGSYAGRDG